MTVATDLCSVEGCDRGRAPRRKLCRMHSSRRDRTGSVGPVDPLIQRYPAGTTCSVEGCEQRPHARGMCHMHRDRVRRLGHATPGSAERLIRLPGTPRDDGHGYVLVRGKRREHRLVMEQILGRPLLSEEQVHHLNGDRSDNRPENLELWSVRQPPGQRVEDKVAWAREILALYDPEYGRCRACGTKGLPNVTRERSP